MSETQDLERELEFRKKLSKVTNLINSAPDLDSMLLETQNQTLDLMDAERITVYACEKSDEVLKSIFKTGSGDQVQTIEVPISPKSIAGYTAFAGETVNLGDAYDDVELRFIHEDLKFDFQWDKASGFRTRQVLAVPVKFEDQVLGVIQLINSVGKIKFNDWDVEACQEIADILGIALHNQRKVTTSVQPTPYGLLLDKGLITREQLDEITAVAQGIKNRSVPSLLIEHYGLDKTDVGQSLSQYYGVPFFDYDGDQRIPDGMREGLNVGFLLNNRFAPIARDEEAGEVVVAMENPFDLLKIDMIRSIQFAPKVVPWVGIAEDIDAYASASYGVATEASKSNLDDILGRLGRDEDDEKAAVEEAELDEDGEVSESSSDIIRLANQLIQNAYDAGASDIHIEPQGEKRPARVRFRVDGICVETIKIPATFRRAIVSRLKIMSQLDIAERRLPQDGKIKFRARDGEIELRVAVLPTSTGDEDVVMRILASSEALPLEHMSFSPRNLMQFSEAVQKPYGIILCVGPTGSGKTTTLHSALKRINTPEKKIWTAEDPVEITQIGLRQVQVHAKIGLNFAAAMRSFLRADPDVIMVGELRDAETAGMAVEASLTGHLVFSTLHTNSAPETVVRLVDLGIDPFNFADALLGILAQRLARRLCKDCKEAYTPAPEDIEGLLAAYGREEFERSDLSLEGVELYRPAGCKKCNDSGYKGRIALHEFMLGTDELKRAIQQRKTVEELRALAKEQGMTTLVQDGIWKVIEGHTDLHQIRAVAMR